MTDATEPKVLFHMRFIGGTVYCPVLGGRIQLGEKYRDEIKEHGFYTCTGCGLTISCRRR